MSVTKSPETTSTPRVLENMSKVELITECEHCQHSLKMKSFYLEKSLEALKEFAESVLYEHPHITGIPHVGISMMTVYAVLKQHGLELEGDEDDECSEEGED